MRNNKFEVSKYSQKQVNIFGTELVSTTKKEVLSKVDDNIRKNRKFIIVTPNPEILLEAQKNRILQDVINKAEIKVADGIGIRFAYRYLSDETCKSLGFFRPAVESVKLIKNLFRVLVETKDSGTFPVVKGRELFVDLIQLCSKNDYKVFLLGGTGGVSKKVERKLKKKYKNLGIKSCDGPMSGEDGKPLTEKDEEVEDDVVKKINNFKPDITFVGFGAPKQEIWSSRNLYKLNTKGMMVVGGTFDYISGKEKLPPKWMGKCGLEWLWRLLTQPKRFVRILRATIVFPTFLYMQKLSFYKKKSEVV